MNHMADCGSAGLLKRILLCSDWNFNNQRIRRLKRTVPLHLLKGDWRGDLKGLHLYEAFKGLKGASRGLEKGFKGSFKAAWEGLQGTWRGLEKGFNFRKPRFHIHPLLDRSDYVIRNHRPALCGKLQANWLLRRVSHLLSHFGRLCHEPGRVKSSYTTEGHSSEWSMPLQLYLGACGLHHWLVGASEVLQRVSWSKF